MATVIRLKRGGRTHAPYYRIVVQDSRTAPTGSVIEEIGVYHPCARPEPHTEVRVDLALKWLYSGAKPSSTARDLLSNFGVMEKYSKGVKPEEAAGENAESAAQG